MHLWPYLNSKRISYHTPTTTTTLRKKFHSIKINNKHDPEELLSWCNENLNGYIIYWYDDEIFLTDGRDVFLTKLTWG